MNDPEASPSLPSGTVALAQAPVSCFLSSFNFAGLLSFLAEIQVFFACPFRNMYADLLADAHEVNHLEPASILSCKVF